MSTDKNELELRLATALSPMLLTISIFSLTLVGNTVQPTTTFVDEILCILSGVCILGAAMVADSAMDKADLSAIDRFKFLGGGYLLFCIAAGVMSTVIPLLYIHKTLPNHELEGWRYILYACNGASVTSKLMQNEEKAWTVGMFVLFVGSICATAALRQ